MLRSLKPATSHEDYFIQRYDWLMGWALQLTNHNSEQAEDLVHDAFIQFSLKRPDLAAIENVDAYLNRMLRNMYLSNVRRANLIQDLSISVAAYDSAEIGLRATDPRDQIKVQDELRQICQYACARKESSKAGSTLILRFFHSYYPSEIAKVLRCPQRPVYDWLKIARRETRLYLDDPSSLKFIADNQPVRIRNFGQVGTTVELLSELRQAIFSSSQSSCLPVKELRKLYQEKADVSIDCATAAHLASCPVCLDAVNRLLSLPLLSERFLTERLGKDTGPPEGPGGSHTGGGVTIEPKRKYQRRLKEVVEHRPQELRILVNGFLLGSQHLSAEYNKQTLSINIDEPVGFVEVFSEQWLRLLFFDVDQPINGSVEQQAHAEFTDGRSLDLNLSFRGTWPVLDVVYHDPTFENVESEVRSVAVVQSPTSKVQSSGSQSVKKASGGSLLAKARAALTGLARTDFGPWTLDVGLFLRPATVTAIVGALLTAVVLFVQFQRTTPPITAADILNRASKAEHAIDVRVDQVVHRTINLEERVVSVTAAEGQWSSIRNPQSAIHNSETISRRRLDVWRNGAQLRALRVFDEQNRLVNGEWIRGSVSNVLLHHGSKLQPAASQKIAAATITFAEAWQVVPSAQEFTDLIEHNGNASITESANEYTVNYQRDAAGADGLLRASLVLSRPELRAIKQTLLLKQAHEVREYVFSESSFEQRPLSAVAPAVFEPDPSLLGSDTETRGHGDTESLAASPRLPVSASSAVATVELDVVRQLNQANAFLGEQISVERTPEGQLRVKGVVEADERKTEILRALSSYKSNPAIRIDVVTVAEAVERERQSRSGPVDVTSVEVRKNALPVDPELRSHFSKRGLSGQQLDEAIRGFSERALRHSFQARRRALALKQIAERFSPENLRNLNPEARTKWRAMISEHARAFVQEIASLRRELEAAFPTLASSDEASAEISSDSDLVRAAARLFALGVANDEGARRSFSLYAENPGAAPVKTTQFWKTLLTAESLARSIAAVARS